jgi:hypothetical protein
MLVSQCISSLEEFNTHPSSVRRSKSHLPMNIFIDLKVMNPKSSLIFKATNYISDILFYHYLIAKRIRPKIINRYKNPLIIWKKKFIYNTILVNTRLMGTNLPSRDSKFFFLDA